MPAHRKKSTRIANQRRSVVPAKRAAHAGQPPADDKSSAGNASPTTRERILSASERLFAEHGFSSVSMPMIAKASGITPGAIYKHFDSKAELFFEVVRRTVQSIAAPVEAGSTSDPALLLPHVVAMYTEPRLKRLRQLAVEMHYASGKHPKVLKLLRRSLELRIGQLRDGIAGAQRDGALNARPDAQLLASALMVFIMGLMHMETLLPQLVGDPKWHDFVHDRARKLLDVPDADPKRSSTSQRRRNRELIDGLIASLDTR